MQHGHMNDWSACLIFYKENDIGKVCDQEFSWFHGSVGLGPQVKWCTSSCECWALERPILQGVDVTAVQNVPQVLLFPLSPAQPQIQHRKSACVFLSPWECLSALFLVLTFFSWLSLSDWLLTLTSKFLLIFFTCFLERSYVFFFLKIGYQNTCTKACRWGFKILFLSAIFPHQMRVHFPNISLIYLF